MPNTPATFSVGQRVVDVRDKKAVAGTVVQIGGGKLLVQWPEGRFWQRASDLAAAPKETVSR